MTRIVRWLVLIAVLTYLFGSTFNLSSSAAAQPFVVIVSAEKLNGPVNRGGFPGVHDIAHFIQGITAYADGVKCDEIDFSQRPINSAENGVLQLGLPGQPPECSKRGARVTFTQKYGGAPLVTEFILEPGKTVTLDNLSIQPPHTGTELQPPMTGNGDKLKRRPGHSGLAWAEAAAYAGLVSGISLLLGSLILLRLRGRSSGP